MKKLTNLQMGVIVDKIYKELSEKIEPINKARVEAVDVDKVLKGDKVIPLLKAFREVELEEEALRNKKEDIRAKLKKVYPEYSHYSIPTPEEFIQKFRRKEANLITIDRRDIEANVILSDVTDLETLIANITRSITKNIPELN